MIAEKNTAVLASLLLAPALLLHLPAAQIYVSPKGSDSNPGSRQLPLAAPTAALQKALQLRKNNPQEPIEIILAAGDYYLQGASLVFPPELSGNAKTPTRLQGQGAATRLHAGRKLEKLQWQADAQRPGVWVCQIEKNLHFEQLFLHDKRQILARYPNYRPSGEVFGGFFANWKIPQERSDKWQAAPRLWLHGMHAKDWGSVHFEAAGNSQGAQAEWKGGWQINRPSQPKYAMIEGALGELDAPGEWAYLPHSGLLYYMPQQGQSVPAEGFSIDGAKRMLVLQGQEAQKLANVEISGLSLLGAGRSFMQTKEPLLLGDWCLAREACVFVENSRQVLLKDLNISQGGGTAVLFSGYNRQGKVQRVEVQHMGGGGIYFVGDASAVRSPRFVYGQPSPSASVDQTPGALNDKYPEDCEVSDCYLHHLGMWEKQVAALHVSMAKNIKLVYNSMHGMPRAAINVNDGCWGGHNISHNDAWDTVQETGDHGTFNSWGRDRFWQLDGTWHEVQGEKLALVKKMAYLDVEQPIVLSHNRFDYRGHEYGWGIDLDDGSSNYIIENNLVTAGGIKLREGFGRIVRNNIVIDDSVHAHVWYKQSGDSIYSNIFGANGYSNIQAPMQHSAGIIDKNAFAAASSHVLDQFYSLEQAQKHGIDKQSVVKPARFVDEAKGDYRLSNAADFAALGFVNWDYKFGSRHAAYAAQAAEARELFLRSVPKARVAKALKGRLWGAEVSNIDAGLRSACGLADNKGVFFVNVPKGSVAEALGVQSGQVLLELGGVTPAGIAEVEALLSKHGKGAKLESSWQDQRTQKSFKRRLTLP